MADITEPSKEAKELAAYGRIVRIYRQQGKTPEQIDALTKGHPGRPSEQDEQARAAVIAAAKAVNRPAEAGTGKSKGRPPSKEAKAAKAAATPAKPAASVPVVDANAGPAIGNLPPALEGQWGDEQAGNTAGQ